MLTLLQVDAGSISKTLEYMTDIFGDVSILVFLVIGLSLGFWAARKVIGLVRAR